METQAQPTANDKIIPRVVEDEMKKSYLAYSMSVIVGRALPDVRDGLKPVHRRILYSMFQENLLHNKKYSKCAGIVGDVLKKFHPHGDTAVYDALVRMAQPWNLRFTLIDGQGNFGNVDGDSAAAYRYCIIGDSLLLTEKGLISIERISKKSEEKINLNILSYDGKVNKASKFFNSGRHKTIKIKTNSGYELEGSYNHPVLTWKVGVDFKPKICWKTLENLEEGDIAIINRNYSIFSKKSFSLEEFHPKEGFRNSVGLPKEMNEDLAFLLGALVSEGSFHNKQILFNNKDKEFYNKVKIIIQEQFKGVQLYEREIKGDCTELSIYEQKVVLFLKNIGLNEAKADGKEIPFSVLQSKKEDLRSFLVALFEGDGSVLYKIDKRHGGENLLISYDSKSKKLIKQLKTVLLSFGIVSNHPMLDKRSDCQKLIISSFSNLHNFHKELGFFSKRKQNKLDKIMSLNSSRLSKVDFIPFLNDYLRNKYDKEFLLRNNFDRYNSLNKNYKPLLKLIDKEDKDLIDWLLKNKFYFDQIIEVKKTEQLKEVFSIRVDSNCHSFVANGFINHNTEARLNKLAEELLEDIDKETVSMISNYDATRVEPVVLPSKVPNLLINGSSGIAVGMATNVPPHNLVEVCDGVVAFIDNPEISLQDLMSKIPGPDFPTGGIICGSQGIVDAYKSGHGKIIVRAKIDVEEKKNKKVLIVKEIPYMVNKSQLIEQIAFAVRDKKVQGISDIRDESDRDGMRIVIELKQSANSEVVLNQLYSHSRLQDSFGIINLALVNNQPKVLSLRDIISEFVIHRKSMVTKRTEFDLKKAEEKAHVLEGLIIALNNIDPVIVLIKSSKGVDEAKASLMSDYSLTEVQAKSILEMRLQRLTSLEQDKVRQEHQELLQLISELKSILSSDKRILDIIKQELVYLRENYSDARRTVIVRDSVNSFEDEELIKPEDNIITMTRSGYIKRLGVDTYKEQKRGGKGILGTEVKEEDIVDSVFVANTRDFLLCFTNKGKVHWLKVYQLPEAGRYAKGIPIVNFLPLDNERVTAVIPISSFVPDKFLAMVTRRGVIKKTSLEEFSNPRKGGIVAIGLDNDELVDVLLTDGSKDIIIATEQGLAVRFNENDVRPVGRTAFGVRGVKLRNDDAVVGAVIVDPSKTLLTLAENGYGKRTEVNDYRLTKRGGVGVINIKITDKNGKVVRIEQVSDEDSILFITEKGVIMRMLASQISVIGRNTQGVRVIKLNPDDKLVSSAVLQEKEE